jgi:hypothetical protein
LTNLWPHFAAVPLVRIAEYFLQLTDMHFNYKNQPRLQQRQGFSPVPPGARAARAVELAASLAFSLSA